MSIIHPSSQPSSSQPLPKPPAGLPKPGDDKHNKEVQAASENIPKMENSKGQIAPKQIGIISGGNAPASKVNRVGYAILMRTTPLPIVQTSSLVQAAPEVQAKTPPGTSASALLTEEMASRRKAIEEPDGKSEKELSQADRTAIAERLKRTQGRSQAVDASPKAARALPAGPSAADLQERKKLLQKQQQGSPSSSPKPSSSTSSSQPPSPKDWDTN